MSSLLVAEARRPLAPLAVNTSATYSLTSTKQDRSTHTSTRSSADVVAGPSPPLTRVPQPEKEKEAQLTSSDGLTDPSRRTASRDAHSAQRTDAASPSTEGTTHALPLANEAASVQQLQRQRQSMSPTVDTSHGISVHPPATAKPQLPSRRGSMARLRAQQGRMSVEEQAGNGGDEVQGAKEGHSTFAATAQVVCGVSAAEGNEAQRIFSYRPTLTSPPPAETLSAAAASLTTQSSSPSSSTDAARSTRGSRCIMSGGGTARASPPSAADVVGRGKVLPKGLRSPSAGTDMNATVPDDDADEGSCSSGHSRSTSGEPKGYAALLHHHHHKQEEQRSLQPRLCANAASTALRLPRGEGNADDASAPFHALQFVPPSSNDPFVSPPHSGRSEGADEGRAGVVGSGAATSAAATTRRRAERVDSPPSPRDWESEDAGALLICPFALFGCCRRGMHTAEELRRSSVLHEHLVAVAGRMHRMKARQQQLEQSVVVLQSQLRAQAGVLQHNTAQMERLLSQEKKANRGGKGREGRVAWPAQEREGEMKRSFGAGDRHAVTAAQKGSLPSTVADASLSGDTLSSLEDGEEIEDGRRHSSSSRTHKALPGEFSIDEPQVTDYGVGYDEDDEDEDEDDEGADLDRPHDPSGVDEGTYARRLRSRTESAKQLYTLREFPATAASNGGGKDEGEEAAVRTAQSASPATAAAAAAGVGRNRANSTQPLPSDNAARAQQRSTSNGGSRSLAGVSRADQQRRAHVRHNALVGAVDTHCEHRPHHHNGACISTEVSGMSNVPPYQLPNESVSTISSASFDADYDDADVGEMQQQLLDLSSAGATHTSVEAVGAVRRGAVSPHPKQNRSEGLNRPQLEGQDLREDRPAHRVGRGGEDYSARSTPSLVSTTYRPSQLAQVCLPPSTTAASAVRPISASLSTPLRGVVTTHDTAAEKPLPPQQQQLHQSEPQPATATEAELLTGDVLRMALPLRRPTLIRQTDVVHDRSINRAPVFLPRPAPIGTSRVPSPSPLLTSVQSGYNGSFSGGGAAHTVPSSALSPSTHAAGIMTKVTELRPRRLSAPDSEGRRVNAVDFAGAAGIDLDAAGGEKLVTHAHSYHYTEEESAAGHAASVSALAAPRKKGSARGAERAGLSSRRDSRSPTEKEATARRRQHATSLLSAKEVAAQQEAVPLGLPPRRLENS